jgi:hypothetical protein
MLASVLVTSVGCDKLTGRSDDSAADESPANEGAERSAKKIEEEARAKGEEAVADARGKSDETQDKGSASLEVGGKEWQATRATFQNQGKAVKISASSTQIVGKKVSRQEVTLVLNDFKGPGEYTLGPPSMFLGIGLDGDEIEKAEDDDEKQTEAAIEMLNKAKMVVIIGGKATVTETNDQHVDGTFEWKPPPQLKAPAIVNGKFHAVKPKARK